MKWVLGYSSFSGLQEPAAGLPRPGMTEDA